MVVEMELERSYKCWINTSNKVISFHAIEGYTVLGFHTHEELIDHAMKLTANGYRIQ